MVLENCPKCSRKLGQPLKSTGRQVCMQCGWSDKPRQSAAALASSPESAVDHPQPPTPNPPAPTPKAETPARDLSPMEIQKLLNQASADAMQNMKPRRQQANPSAKKKRFPFLGF